MARDWFRISWYNFIANPHCKLFIQRIPLFQTTGCNENPLEAVYKHNPAAKIPKNNALKLVWKLPDYFKQTCLVTPRLFTKVFAHFLCQLSIARVRLGTFFHKRLVLHSLIQINTLHENNYKQFSRH